MLEFCAMYWVKCYAVPFFFKGIVHMTLLN